MERAVLRRVPRRGFVFSHERDPGRGVPALPQRDARVLLNNSKSSPDPAACKTPGPGLEFTS